MTSDTRPLHRAEPDDIAHRIDDLTAVRDRLVELNAGDVAVEIDQILGTLGEDPQRTDQSDAIARQLAKIREVLKAVELQGSGDYDEKQVAAAIDRFRESHD